MLYGWYAYGKGAREQRYVPFLHHHLLIFGWGRLRGALRRNVRRATLRARSAVATLTHLEHHHHHHLSHVSPLSLLPVIPSASFPGLTLLFTEPPADCPPTSELAREKMWSRIHLIPVLQAEEDRDQVRRHLADQARERELLGGENAKVYHADRFVKPTFAVTPAERSK